MAHQADAVQAEMEFAEIPGTSLKVSRVAIGTWAIGGWMWGGTDEAESIATIRAAIEHGINIIYNDDVISIRDIPVRGENKVLSIS